MDMYMDMDVDMNMDGKRERGWVVHVQEAQRKNMTDREADTRTDEKNEL